MSKEVIKVRNISKKYLIGTGYTSNLREALSSFFSRKSKSEEFWALKDISFEVKQGEVVGIIGKNGAGKTTLLKILSRITYPTSGQVELKGKVASLLEVGTGFHSELTGRENIFLNGSILGMKKDEIKHVFDEIVDFSGIENFIDTPVKRYSSGMYLRLAFSVAAYLRSEILLVDEILAVGDLEFQNKCLGKMDDISKGGKTVLLVSHNLGSLMKFCINSLLIQEGRLIGIGKTDEMVEKYLNNTEKNKRLYDNSSTVRRIQASFNHEQLIVELDYNLEYTPIKPSFGLLLKDRLGSTICGVNPEIYGLQINRNKFQKSGSIRLSIDNLSLVSGIYKISIWFSDGNSDVFTEDDAITVNYINDKYPKYNDLLNVGSIIPACRYEYYDN